MKALFEKRISSKIMELFDNFIRFEPNSFCLDQVIYLSYDPNLDFSSTASHELFAIESNPSSGKLLFD